MYLQLSFPRSSPCGDHGVLVPIARPTPPPVNSCLAHSLAVPCIFHSTEPGTTTECDESTAFDFRNAAIQPRKALLHFHFIKYKKIKALSFLCSEQPQEHQELYGILIVSTRVSPQASSHEVLSSSWRFQLGCLGIGSWLPVHTIKSHSSWE